MKSLNLSLDEFEILYILNCIALTRNLIYKGNAKEFDTYFNKRDYTEHNWNLWSLQKRLVIEGNKKLYNSSRIDMSWAQIIYLKENKSLNCFTKEKIFRYKKQIRDFEKNLKQANIKQIENKNLHFKFLSKFKKFA